jgi:hypothetical protein
MDISKIVTKVRRVAERQDGRITWRQLLAAGAGKYLIHRWTQEGWLVPIHAGVYVVGAKVRSRPGTFRSALLALGDEAALSFRAAGAHWETLGGRVPTEVTIPPTTGRGHRDGIVVHRAVLPPEHVTVHKGLRVTTLIRTQLDLAAVLPEKKLARVFEQAQVKHHLDPNALAADVVCWRGRRGIRALRSVLDGAVDPALVRSVLELRFLELCEQQGIVRPLVNEPFGPWVPDFTWPSRLVIVETDGWNFHRTAAARRRDAEKDAWLRARGFTVIRLTWRDVTEHPVATAARVQSALTD